MTSISPSSTLAKDGERPAHRNQQWPQACCTASTHGTTSPARLLAEHGARLSGRSSCGALLDVNGRGRPTTWSSGLEPCPTLALIQRPLVHLKVGQTPFQPSDPPEHDRAQKPRRRARGWTARAALQPIVRRTAQGIPELVSHLPRARPCLPEDFLAPCQRPAHAANRWCGPAPDGGRINAVLSSPDKRRIVMLCSNSAHACLANSITTG
jgi:hypothetical protein